MPYSTKTGARIYFEVMGPVDGQAIIMIEGMTVQLIGWRQEFCQKLVDQGLRVIRLDNRDVGMSEKFGGPEDVDGGYSLSDMAKDVFGVLDTLSIDRAHIVGQSMGGMVAQVMAIENAARVRSLTLFYTAPGPGQRYFAEGFTEQALAQPQPVLSRTDAIDAFVTRESISRSIGYPFDETWIRTLAAQSYDRGYSPGCVPRHFMAISRSGDRLARLKGISIPTAIIHGRADAWVKMEAPLDLGQALVESEVHIYPGMGHEIVEPLWDEFAHIIARTTARG